MEAVTCTASPSLALVKYWGKKRNGLPATSSLAVTLGATLAVFPLIIYYFHYLSLVGLPANLLALPALPAIIVAALLTAQRGQNIV